MAKVFLHIQSNLVADCSRWRFARRRDGELAAMDAEIMALAWAKEHEDALVFWRDAGASEADLLRNFIAELCGESWGSLPYSVDRWIGCFAFGADPDYLRRRCALYGLYGDCMNAPAWNLPPRAGHFQYWRRRADLTLNRGIPAESVISDVCRARLLAVRRSYTELRAGTELGIKQKTNAFDYRLIL